MNMSNWKAKITRKKGRASQTTGISKSDACQANKLERWFATCSRSYKHPQYGRWLKSKNGKSGVQKDRVG